MHTHIFAKKSLGQHFLKNPKVVEKMIEAAGLRHSDLVLEIGPGTGMLTRGLLSAGARVIAIEADKRAVDVLEERFHKDTESGQLVIHHADVRERALADFVPKDTSYVIIANIPYYLSGMLLRETLSAAHQPETIVFLVQKEVAERIARSKKESLLSLSVKVYGVPRYIATVSKGNFSPAPKVDSAILAIENISRKNFENLNEARFFEVLHAGFASRRKQLAGNLAALCKRTVLLELFETLGIPRNARGEDLPVETWLMLAKRLTHYAQPAP
ncbi:ribosomal RNA small subunit methyltransferase A [Candidatus Kaiserbacteria bacterium]|nr:ribosomal RNA small subunit methyltransferase A [Candidatus Kaiserbacteria bacterium]